MSRWPVHKVAELANVTTGIPARVKDDAPSFAGEEYRVVSVGALQEGGIASVETLPLAHLDLTDAERARAMLRRGDVLLSARGAALRIALVGAEHTGAVANHTILVLHPLEHISGAALYAALRLPRVVHELEQLGRASTATRAWRPVDVERIALPVPPLPVQQKVEELLDAEGRHQAAARRALALRSEAVWSLLGEVLEGETP